MASDQSSFMTGAGRWRPASDDPTVIVGSRIAWTTFCFPALQESPDETRLLQTLFLSCDRPSSAAQMAKRRSCWAVGNSNIAFFALDEKMPPASGSTGIPVPSPLLGNRQRKSRAITGRIRADTNRKIMRFIERGGIQSVDLR